MAERAVTARPWVVMLSGSAWAVQAHRQHALARELAGDVADGYRVLFVDPPTNRLRWRAVVRAADPGIWVVTPITVLPLGRQIPIVNRLGRRATARSLDRWLNARPAPRVLWIDEDLAFPMIGSLHEAAVIYDATDLDWTFTRRWNRPNLQRALRAAVGGADLVLASSSALPSSLAAPGKRIVVIANACDPDMFTPAGPTSATLDKLPRPILGYLGAIDTRAFDGDLVAAVARAHPEWTFALVGPSTPAGTALLVGLANVHILDAVPFVDAPAVVRSCDVGIIPYRTGGLIDYVHPKKCFEYLACGKAVIATPLPALADFGDAVALASGPTDFADCIDGALRQQADGDARERRRKVAAMNSWQRRGDEVRALLAELVAP